MRILQDTAPAPPEEVSSPPPPPEESSPPPPPDSSPPPPLRKSPPPKARAPPPPQMLTPGELDEGWSGALADAFTWPPPSKKHREDAIIGSTVGVGLAILLVLIFCLCCCRGKKKRKDYDDHESYYDREKPRRDSGGHYYNNSTHGNRNWQNKGSYTSKDVTKKYTQQHSSEQWVPAPPPPPPNMSSGAFSGGATMPPPHPSMVWSGGHNKSTFSYNDLAAATDGFAQANLLGQGGFGYVHKGVLPNGKEVAVKSLKSNSGQGEREFQAEVEIISRVHHRHLVSLVGYCISGSQRMLVYEFVANSTLEDHLHEPDRPTMEFSTRLKIALGSAKGFSYLHEDCHPRIIHRDVKAANILLDDNFEAKIACSVNARKDGGEYWQGVVKDQKVEGNGCQTVGETSIFQVKPKYEESFANDYKRRFHTNTHVNHLGFVRFEPRPSATSYVNNLKPQDEKSFVRDFEPRPSATSYVGNVKPRNEESSVKDFEPRPNISAYTDDVSSKKEKSQTNDFEPRPNVSAYTDDVSSKKEKSNVGDFKPRPNISAYTDDVSSKKKTYGGDFEPRPNISAYGDE